MSEFEVTLKEEITYVFTVDAEDEEDAIDQGWELLEIDDNRDVFFSDSEEIDSYALELDEE